MYLDFIEKIDVRLEELANIANEEEREKFFALIHKLRRELGNYGLTACYLKLTELEKVVTKNNDKERDLNRLLKQDQISLEYTVS
jgi:HPt (histidine-containing phosphotransfer) domain-containing protein